MVSGTSQQIPTVEFLIVVYRTRSVILDKEFSNRVLETPVQNFHTGFMIMVPETRCWFSDLEFTSTVPGTRRGILAHNKN